MEGQPAADSAKNSGVAHIAIFSKDVEASRRFYTGLLGYQEAFDLKNPDGSPSLTFFKINERQYIEARSRRRRPIATASTISLWK